MPSWRMRLFNVVITAMVRRRQWGEPERLARRARRVFGPPMWYARLRSIGVDVVRAASPVRGEWIIPRNARERGVILYCHGGGYVSCSATTHRPNTTTLARLTGFRVFALDYRLAPEHQFPSALDDATAAYDWLLAAGQDPSSIAIGGDSAGGGMTFGLLLRLRERDRRDLPACAFTFSPWTDLAGTGPSGVENDGRCKMFRPQNLAEFARAYLGDVSAHDPFASPVYADLAHLPPVLLHVGSTELLLDDARRMHDGIQRAGGASTLRVFDDTAHGWQMLDGLVPEARDSLAEASAFVRGHLT